MRELTVKEYAAVERVTIRTIYNWIKKEALQVRRTPGGQIRIVDRRETTRTVFLSANESGPHV